MFGPSHHVAKLLALLLVLAIPTVASAQEATGKAPAVTAAADHFRRGVQLYDEGDSAAALVEFRRAYELGPQFRVLYNIGQAHYELRDYASAHRAFNRYLTEGGANVPENRRREVDAELVRLTERIARVRVTARPDGARVFVDDAFVGTSPLTEPLLVNLGGHELRVEHAGRFVRRRLDVAGGDDVAISVAVEYDSLERPSTTSGRRTLGYVLAGAGLAFVGAAVATDLVLVPNAIDDFEARRRRDDPGTRSAQASVSTLQAISLVGYAAGAVLAGVGLTLVLLPGKRSTAQGSPTLAITLGGASVATEGRF